MKKLLSALLGIFGLFIVPAYAALPSGYTELTYIQTDGSAYIDTGILLSNTDVFEISFQSLNSLETPIMGAISGGTSYTSTGNLSVTYTTANSPSAYSVYCDGAAGNTYYSWNGGNRDDGLKHTIKYNGLNIAPTLDGVPMTQITTHTLTENTPTVTTWLFGRNNTSTGTLSQSGVRIYDVNIQGKGHFIPAKNSSGVVGMYDTVNNRFYTNAGSGSFVAGDPVYVCNLFNKNATNTNNGYIGNAYLNQEETAVTTNSYATSEYINVQPSTTYFWKIGEGTSHSAPRIAYYDANRNYIASSNSIGYSTSFTTPSNCAYVRLPLYKNEIGVAMLTKGNTAPTSYIAYNPNCGCDGTVVNYTSATGTGVQSGTPTPTNPIEPVFYTQGDMVLRKVGDYADTYDATTGKITRRVGVKVFGGTENWSRDGNTTWFYNSSIKAGAQTGISSHGKVNKSASGEFGFSGSGFVEINTEKIGIETTNNAIQQYLAQQYANGTPVTIYYPLETETTEDWPASYCETPIKIATTKYNESAFSPLNTALANAISVVDTVVSNTITQAGRIATLQAQKQTRPNDIADDNEKCPAGKKCLLVEDASGVPHWYEIVETLLPAGYTQLQYIESTGTQYIDTGINGTDKTSVHIKYIATSISDSLGFGIIGYQRGFKMSPTFQRVLWTNIDNDQFRYGDKLTDTFKKVNINEVIEETFGNGSWIYNGENIPLEATNSFTTSPNTMVLFGLKSQDTVSFAKIKLYFCSIKENGTLVRDFIPAKNPDGVVGMYDTVSGQFFTNAGDGEFIAGDPVSE